VTTDLRPKCPKCGEPARHVHALAWVTCVLEDDRSLGTILSANKPTETVDPEFRCGGGHIWKEKS
jgi:hypothetical protein